MIRKILIPFIFLALAGVSVTGFASTKETTLSIKQMDCVTCPVVVRAALYALDGVEDVIVSMTDKTAVVKYNDDSLTTSDLASAVSNAGFPAVVKE